MTEHDEGEVPERARRRTFTAAYKLKILAEYEAASPGERGVVLRREGLYSSHLVEWRRSRDVGAVAGLSATRGRPPADPVERDNARLRDRNAKFEQDLDTARQVIAIQGKLALGSLGRSVCESARRVHAPAVRAEFTAAVERLTDTAVVELAGLVGTVAACTAAGRARATHYRWHRTSAAPSRPAPVAHVDRAQPAALSPAEREQVLAVLHSERFADAAPAQVWATLLDEGVYLGSQSTFYRLLRQVHGDVRERRSQATHPAKVKPELVAHGPNQVWSWDITSCTARRSGPTSTSTRSSTCTPARPSAGWSPAASPPAWPSSCWPRRSRAERVPAKQLTIHADRGSSMASTPVALLLADLGVTKTHSRPRVSNDNPYSESQFKTLKYCPAFPGTFTSLADARTFCREFFSTYNHHHRHAGLGLLTPHVVHSGQAQPSTPPGRLPSTTRTPDTATGSAGHPAHPRSPARPGSTSPRSSHKPTLTNRLNQLPRTG